MGYYDHVLVSRADYTAFEDTLILSAIASRMAALLLAVNIPMTTRRLLSESLGGYR